MVAMIGCWFLAGYAAHAEIGLFGLRRTEREQLANSGLPLDGVLERLLASPRNVLAVLLILRTFALVGGSYAAFALGTSLADGQVTGAAGRALVAIAFVAASLLGHVFVGDVVPRAIALRSPLAAARRVAPLQWLLQVVLWPIHAPIERFGALVTSLFVTREPVREQDDVSEEEFRTLVDVGSANGEVDQRERRLIHRVFEFGDKTVADIMTPRERVVGVSYDLPMARLVREIATRGFSRVPVFHKSLDNVRGILFAKELVVVAAGQGPARPLSQMLTTPLYVPKATPVQRLFHLFKQKRLHLALVVNEYGKVLGLVTMTDVMQLLFGRLADEQEETQEQARVTEQRLSTGDTIPPALREDDHVAPTD
ncbi:MAG: HlyC/CorC family transporter [Myxococcales bacterium]|nr:HlyC/CorC family transporter [Myxococcales bacterium]